MSKRRTQRVVRVFISSTFENFETERKVLVGNVFPRLRERFAGRGVSVIAVDLRWGLENQQIESLGLVDACLDQVVDCYPYFLGLLGWRYGTVVSLEELRASRILRTHPLGRRADAPISITELEFRIGALQSNNEYALFFSSGMGEAFDEKSVALLREVERSGRSLTPYDSIDRFEQVVYDQLVELVDARFPEEARAQDPEAAAQEATLAHHVEAYVPGSPVVEEALRRLRDGRSVYLQGEKGVGKSAALAYCYEELSGTAGAAGPDAAGPDGPASFLFFCNTGYCSDDLGILRKIAAFFEQRHGIRLGVRADDGFADLMGKLTAGLSAATFAQPVLLFVDAVEQLKSSRNLWRAILGICDQNPSVTCMLTGTQHLDPDCELHLTGLEPMQVEGLVRRELLESGKTLRQPVLDQILSCPAARNPIMLKGILNELSVSGRYLELEGLVGTLCAIESVPELFAYVVERVSSDVEGLGLGGAGVRRAAAFLAGVHFGATEDEILSVSGLVPLGWAALRSALNPYLVSFDGRYRFNHQLIEREAASCLGEKDRALVIEAAVGEYAGAPRSDARVIEWASWAQRSGDEALLARLVLDPAYFSVLLRYDEDGLRAYLSQLSKDESVLREPLGRLLEARASDADGLRALSQALSRSGCVLSCIAVADFARSRGACTADLLTMRARAIYQRGDYANVSSPFEEALGALVAEGRRGTPAHALLLLQYSIAEKSCAHGLRALEMAREACEIYDALGVSDNDALWCQTFRASLEFTYGRGAGPETFADVLARQWELSGERSFAYSRLICYSWQSFLLAGDLEAADRLTAQSLEGLLRTAGEGPDYAWALTNRATVLACLGRVEEARLCSRRSAELNSQTAGGGMHVYSVTGTMNELLLDCLQARDEGRFGERRAEVERGLSELWETALAFHGPDHPYVLNVEANLALVRLAGCGGDAAAAREELLGVSRRLAEAMEGDNADSAFLEACAWACGGAGDRDALMERCHALGTRDFVTEQVLAGCVGASLRLVLNNGAALYLVPTAFA